jgi:hypothetical protein
MTPDEPTPGKPIEIRVEDSIGLSMQEALGMHKTGLDSEGLLVRESDWTANAETEQGTIVQATSIGRPSQGEADTEACSQRFVNYRRRSLGEVWWGDPIEVDQRDRPWIDYEAFDRRDAKGERLLMQVRRAMVGDERYREWFQKGQVGLPPGTTPAQAAALVLEDIGNKPPADNVILLLDAVRLPWLALREVVAEVRRHYAASTEKGGFRAVYVVPWAESAIRRLDQPE